MTKTYDDETWLTTNKPRVTLAELEAFMEKVAIKIDAGISESEARQQAYAEIILSKVVR